MDATSWSSGDGASAAKGTNVFARFAWGFHHIASGADGLLKSETMSVGPQLLVCLPGAGVAVCSIPMAGWLEGLTGVGHLTTWACCASPPVDVWSIKVWLSIVPIHCRCSIVPMTLLVSPYSLSFTKGLLESCVSVVLYRWSTVGEFLCWVHQSVVQSYVATATINFKQQMHSMVVLVFCRFLDHYWAARLLLCTLPFDLSFYNKSQWW